MIFRDRKDAGHRLAEKLHEYQQVTDVVVVALPRGGVEIGRAVADKLNVPLDIVVPRKIGAPENPEYAIGAITETGETVWNADEKARTDQMYIVAATKREKAEARRRLDLYREGMPPRDLEMKTVIIVDDGIATGFTMLAAIRTVKKEKPRKIIVAVPVAPPHAHVMLALEADEVIILSTPADFEAIGAFYKKFPQVDDDEVVRLMKQ